MRVRPSMPAILTLALVTAMLAASGVATAASLPGVSTGRAANVTYSSAVLTGSLAAKGQPTNYFFQYGTNSSYGAQTPLAPGGRATATANVSQLVSGLKPITVYHYRLVAFTAAGRTNGADRTFTTPKIPLSLQLAGVPNPVPFGESFLVEGALTGTGSANHAIVLQANPFPYTAGFKTLGNPELTTATGGFSFPVLGLLENAQLRVQTLGSPIITSPTVLENVAVRVSFHARRTHRRGFVRLYGAVTPAEVGAQVGFQLLVAGGHTVNEGGTSVKTGTPTVSSFSRTVRLRHSGVYRALVKVTDGAHVSAYSAPILIR
jgi:hypothetical protein